MATYIRENQADIRLTVDGVSFFGSWATYSGGDLTAAEAKTRPGAMGKEVSIGGPASRGDITITIQWDEIILASFNDLESRVGSGDAKVSVNWLDRKGVAIPGALFAKTGTLKSVSDPNYDTNGNAVGMLTAVIGADEAPAA